MMKNKLTCLPNRGDIIWLNFDPRVGHEQSGHRPALVISRKALADFSATAIVCPITSTVKGLSFEVPLTGTKTSGAVLPLQVRSVDLAARRAQFIEHAPAAVVDRVWASVRALID